MEVQTGSHDHSSSTGERNYRYFWSGKSRWVPRLPHVGVCDPNLLVAEVYQQILMSGREVGLSGGKVHFLVRRSVCAFALGAG